MKALDRILLERSDEQIAAIKGPAGRRRRDSWRSDVRNPRVAPKRRKRRAKCLGCGRPAVGRSLSYCASCGERVRHGTSLEAVEIVRAKGST